MSRPVMLCSAAIEDILTQFSIDRSLPEFGGPKINQENQT